MAHDELNAGDGVAGRMNRKPPATVPEGPNQTAVRSLGCRGSRVS